MDRRKQRSRLVTSSVMVKGMFVNTVGWLKSSLGGGGGMTVIPVTANPVFPAWLSPCREFASVAETVKFTFWFSTTETCDGAVTLRTTFALNRISPRRAAVAPSQCCSNVASNELTVLFGPKLTSSTTKLRRATPNPYSSSTAKASVRGPIPTPALPTALELWRGCLPLDPLPTLLTAPHMNPKLGSLHARSRNFLLILRYYHAKQLLLL